VVRRVALAVGRRLLELEARGFDRMLRGGEVDDDPESQRRGWADALALPSVRGLMVGRSMLFPPDGDVDAAVAAAASLLGR